MAKDLTPAHNLALSLLFDALGMNRANRTHEEYQRIKAALPPLKQLHYRINERLQTLTEAGFFANAQICRFKAGHKIIQYEPYPTSISIETVRQALTWAGWREPRGKRRSVSY
jgi:hypothetical protein